MRFNFTIFLLILNIITFGFIALLNQRTEETGLKAGSLSESIGHEIIEANRIVLRGAGIKKARVLTRKGSTWAMTEPIQWAANYFAVNRILNQLQFLEEEASFSVQEIKKIGQSLGDYGLESPLLQLSISSTDNTSELSMGNPTEIGNNVYLLGPDGNQIYVVNHQAIDSLLVDLNDLRSRKIFDIPVFEIEALGLQIRNTKTTANGELRVRIAHTNGGWTLEAPLNADADTSRVSNVINTLSAIKVERFIEPNASDPVLQGLESPFMRVTLQGNKRQQTLLLGNKDPSAQGKPTYFARLDGNPTIFTVQAAPFNELQKAQEDLRERNFMNFTPSKLHSIHITEDDLKIRLQKLETGEWQVIHSKKGTNITPQRADHDVMIELIASLRSLRAIDFANDTSTPSDLDRFGFNSPRRTISLTHSDDSETELILAHPENENRKLYARVNGTEFIYEVDRRSTLETFSLNELKYRNRILDTLPEAARIHSIKLENLDNGTTIFEYVQKDPLIPWVALLAEETNTRRHAVLQLIEDLRNFKVKSYLIDHYTDAYPLDNEASLPWSFQISAKILLPGDETAVEDHRSYVFTKRISGTQQPGGSKKYNSVFQIQQSTLDALYILTEDMPLPPEAKGEAVPEPQAIEAIPEPQSPAIKKDA